METKKIPLSVVVLTKNEENRLPDCLKSVPWADELLVLDDMSTDRTVEIAKEFGARVEKRKMDIEGRHRNYGYRLAKHEWVLSLHADERITPELAQEIKKVVLENNPECHVYTMPVKTYIGKEWVRGAGYYPSARSKLFRRDKFRYKEERIHPPAIHEGKTRHLKGDVLHYSCRDLEHWVSKINRETTLEADKWIRDGRKVSLLRSLRKTADRFLKNYFLKDGWRCGFYGFLVSVFHGLYQLLAYAKYREMKRS